MNRLPTAPLARAVVSVLALAAALGAASASAQEYPNRPVRIIVPFGLAGRPTSGRASSRSPCRRRSKQSFVVENRPGAGAVIGTDAVAKAAPDGYTLLLMSNTHTANETLLPNRPYR